MPDLTKLIKDKITKIYKTPELFAKSTGIPYETVISAINGNIGDLVYNDVANICNKLRITMDFLPLDSQTPQKTYMFSHLDTEGVQKVYSAAISEHNKILEKKSSKT